jgi:hypothetical protein
MMTLDEVINNISQEDLDFFEQLYSKTDRFGNFLERKKYLERNYPALSKKHFYYTHNTMFRVVASITESNFANQALEKPYHIMYTVGLEYGYKHPELIVLNGAKNEDQKKPFEKIFHNTLYELGWHTKYGLVIEPNIDYTNEVKEYPAPVPLVFKPCTQELLESITETFTFEITHFYKYFTFDEHKIPRKYKLPLVLDLTNTHNIVIP